MFSPQDIIISKFRFTYSKSNEKVKLLDELNNIKSDKYKSIIKECRIALHNNDKEGYSNLKSQLPCVTFGATFQGTHGIKNLLFYNHLLILDIDKITNEKLRISFISYMKKTVEPGISWKQLNKFT